METRTYVLSLRVSQVEWLTLKLIAEHEQRRSRSETLRELIREAAQRRGLWPPETKQEVVT